MPFFLRTGKRMAEGQRIISIAFREPPKSMFPAGSGVGAQGPDHLTFDLADASKMSLSFYGKRPGPGMRLDKLSLQFAMHDTGLVGDVLEAYERLILDAMRGDHTLFTTAEGIERLWEVSVPLLEAPPPVRLYPGIPGARNRSTSSSRRTPGGCRSSAPGAIPTRRAVDPTSTRISGAGDLNPGVIPDLLALRRGNRGIVAFAFTFRFQVFPIVNPTFQFGMNALAPILRTNGQVARWIAIQTCIALAVGLPTTLLAVIWLCGGDFSRTFSAGAMLRYSMLLTLFEIVAFTPPIALRSVGTLQQLNLLRDELEKLASTDPLTGLLNRRGFDAAAVAMAASPGVRGGPAAALLCDLDYFKQVNDEHGHVFGDAALRQVAEVLREAAARHRQVVIGRQGGEEFIVLLGGVLRSEALQFAESLRATFAARPIVWNGACAQITMSIGFAATPSCDGDVEKLIAGADAALYEAKREGRNRVAISVDTLRVAA